MKQCREIIVISGQLKHDQSVKPTILKAVAPSKSTAEILPSGLCSRAAVRICDQEIWQLARHYFSLFAVGLIAARYSSISKSALWVSAVAFCAAAKAAFCAAAKAFGS